MLPIQNAINPSTNGILYDTAASTIPTNPRHPRLTNGLSKSNEHAIHVTPRADMISIPIAFVVTDGVVVVVTSIALLFFLFLQKNNGHCRDCCDECLGRMYVLCVSKMLGCNILLAVHWHCFVATCDRNHSVSDDTVFGAWLDNLMDAWFRHQLWVYVGSVVFY